MIPVKINGQRYSIPASVEEITTGQFMALRQSKDIIDEICALTGIARVDAMNFATKDDLLRCYQLLTPIGEDLKKNGINGRKMPKQIMLGGKIIPVPKKLNLEPVGAFINVHNLIAEEHNKAAALKLDLDCTDIIPKVLAHYFYQPYSGGLYSDEAAEGDKFMALINQIPFVQAVPIANFFFSEVPELVKVQKQVLPPEPPKPEHLEARISELDKYGWLGAIDVLAGGDVTRWNEVMTVSFERVITKLALNRDKANYSDRLHEVLKKKKPE